MKIILILSMGLFIGSINAQTIPSYIPTDSLVAYFSFEETISDQLNLDRIMTSNGIEYSKDRFGNDNSSLSLSGGQQNPEYVASRYRRLDS